jgi:hypothetical protein
MCGAKGLSVLGELHRAVTQYSANKTARALGSNVCRAPVLSFVGTELAKGPFHPLRRWPNTRSVSNVRGQGEDCSPGRGATEMGTIGPMPRGLNVNLTEITWTLSHNEGIWSTYWKKKVEYRWLQIQNCVCSNKLRTIAICATLV